MLTFRVLLKFLQESINLLIIKVYTGKQYMQNIPHKSRMHLEETQNYFIFYCEIFFHHYLFCLQVQKNRDTELFTIHTLNFISCRKIEWSVLSIYFYEVQNDKTLLLTLCHNESINDVQWNKWKAKVQQKLWKWILFTACCHPLELTPAGDY